MDRTRAEQMAIAVLQNVVDALAEDRYEDITAQSASFCCDLIY